MSIALFPHGRRACFALSPLRRWFSTNIAPNNDTQQAKEITQDTSKVVPGIRDDSSSQSQEALSPAAQRLLDVFHQSDSQSVAGDGTPRVTDKDRAEASIPTYLKPEYNVRVFLHCIFCSPQHAPCSMGTMFPNTCQWCYSIVCAHRRYLWCW